MATERRLKKKEAVKDSILCATRTLILNEGWQAVSIRKIADAIGYSLPVVYTHYENKDAILEEFVKLGFGQLSEAISLAKSEFSDPEQQLTAIAYSYFDFALGSREYYQMMFGLGMPGCERVNQIPAIASFSKILISTIKAIAHADLSDTELKLKFHTFWSILHGLTAINMVNSAATPDHMQKMVLQDAVQGFIKNINNSYTSNLI